MKIDQQKLRALEGEFRPRPGEDLENSDLGRGDSTPGDALILGFAVIAALLAGFVLVRLALSLIAGLL